MSDNPSFECRTGCAACCIAPSIHTPIPDMPDGKPAGVRCVQLDDHGRCKLFHHPSRPAVCKAFMPAPDICGKTSDEAMQILTLLEQSTAP